MTGYRQDEWASTLHANLLLFDPLLTPPWTRTQPALSNCGPCVIGSHLYFAVARN